MGTTKLTLYNAALYEIGERKLSGLTENRKPRRVLDDVYDDVLSECLESGSWNFAKRTVQLDADSDVTTNFGFKYVFAKPSDWVVTIAISVDEYFNTAMSDLEYKDEAGNIYTEYAPIYLAYVSDDAQFGMDLTKWPATFSRFTALTLADRIVDSITLNFSRRNQLTKMKLLALRKARTKDALGQGRVPLRPGRVISARRGFDRRERGFDSKLIG